jgi:hypothetical protein
MPLRQAFLWQCSPDLRRLGRALPFRRAEIARYLSSVGGPTACAVVESSRDLLDCLLLVGRLNFACCAQPPHARYAASVSHYKYVHTDGVTRAASPSVPLDRRSNARPTPVIKPAFRHWYVPPVACQRATAKVTAPGWPVHAHWGPHRHCAWPAGPSPGRRVAGRAVTPAVFNRRAWVWRRSSALPPEKMPAAPGQLVPS